MNSDLEARIRTRAYQIWQSDPSPEGNAEKHWEEACRQLSAEGSLTDGEAPLSADQSADRETSDRPAPDEELLQDIPDSEPVLEGAGQSRKK